MLILIMGLRLLSHSGTSKNTILILAYFNAPFLIKCLFRYEAINMPSWVISAPSLFQRLWEPSQNFRQNWAEFWFCNETQNQPSFSWFCVSLQETLICRWVQPRVHTFMISSKYTEKETVEQTSNFSLQSARPGKPPCFIAMQICRLWPKKDPLAKFDTEK